jgi:mono/diheme cytochrome c family protein
MTFARASLLGLTLLVCALLAQAAANGAWLNSVPSKDHEKANPYQGQVDAIAAGRNIFEEHCAKCHGEDAQGTKKRPSLRTDRVQQQATPGDLHWLLVNGNMKKGMPSWSKLGDPQIWQVISYLRSIRE